VRLDGVRLARARSRSLAAKPILIVGGTAIEAVELARVYRRSTNWRFVVDANDLLGKTPATHELVFTGDWRDREHVDAIRERAIGQGFQMPR
jgi:hypothetical protein